MWAEHEISWDAPHSPWGLRPALLAGDPRSRRSSGACSQTHVCIPHKWQRPPGRTELWAGGGGPTWMPYVPGHTATEEKQQHIAQYFKWIWKEKMLNQSWGFSSRKTNASHCNSLKVIIKHLSDTSEHEWSSQKIINSPSCCSKPVWLSFLEQKCCACCDEKTSRRFEITRGWVNDKRDIIIRCTVPLSNVYCRDLKLETLRMFAVVFYCLRSVSCYSFICLHKSSVSAWLQERKITHRQKQHAVHPEGGVTGVERQPAATQSTEEGRIGPIQDNDTRRKEK